VITLFSNVSVKITDTIPLFRRLVLIEQTCNIRIFASSLYKTIGTNEALRRILATIAAVEKQYLLNIVSVCVALVIRHAKRMLHIVISILPHSTIFFHIFSGTA
jgi:hypothetical protein